MEGYSEQTGNTAPRVLIVDDNPEIREIIRILLSGEGYELEEAKNGNEALEKAGETAFDLIILDIMIARHGRVSYMYGDQEEEQRADLVPQCEDTGGR